MIHQHVVAPNGRAQVATYVPPATKRRLQMLAESNDRTLSGEVAAALAEYIDNQTLMRLEHSVA
jgi:predicted transcriptional regulator